MSLLSWLAGRRAQSRRKPRLGARRALRYTSGFACHVHALVEERLRASPRARPARRRSGSPRNRPGTMPSQASSWRVVR